jgi:hypothetical protein
MRSWRHTLKLKFGDHINVIEHSAELGGVTIDFLVAQLKPRKRCNVKNLVAGQHGRAILA